MTFKAQIPDELRRGRVSVPTVRQIDTVECGAACLAMVLTHYGREVSLEELRIACGVNADGSKASDICKAARSYGLAAKGFRKEPDGLRKMPVPSIIHWKFNHYVVLEGLNDKWAWVNDPAIGPRRVPRTELDEAFTGVVLAFEPGEAFQTDQKQSTLTGIWRSLKKASGAIGTALLAWGIVLVSPAPSTAANQDGGVTTRAEGPKPNSESAALRSAALPRETRR